MLFVSVQYQEAPGEAGHSDTHPDGLLCPGDRCPSHHLQQEYFPGLRSGRGQSIPHRSFYTSSVTSFFQKYLHFLESAVTCAVASSFKRSNVMYVLHEHVGICLKKSLPVSQMWHIFLFLQCHLL